MQIESSDTSLRFLALIFEVLQVFYGDIPKNVEFHKKRARTNLTCCEVLKSKKKYTGHTLVVDKTLCVKNESSYHNGFDIKIMVKSHAIFFKSWGPFCICKLIQFDPF